MITDIDSIITRLRDSGCITVNKFLVNAIGVPEAMLYSELCSRYKYFKDRGLLDEEGYFYNTQYDLQAATGIGEKAQRRAIKNLVDLELLSKKLKGLPATRYFKINSNEEELLKLLRRGALKLKAIENRSDTSSGGNLKLQKKFLDVTEGSPNNTKLNNPNENNTNAKGVRSNSTHTGSVPLPLCVALYYELFEEHFKQPHPNLSSRSIENAAQTINEFMDEFFLELEDIEVMIKKYFTCNFSHGTDYHLSHFANWDILENRYYEEFY